MAEGESLTWVAKVRAASRFHRSQNTHVTREADQVQLVQEGEPGVGRGASQPEATPLWDRSWPTVLDWTGYQDQLQNGRDEGGAGFACLLIEADLLPPDPTGSCGG